MISGYHIPIFCTADIPASILNNFLECLDETVEENMRMIVNTSATTTADYVVFMTSLGIEAITEGALAPAEAFTSPFLGWTLEQLGDWSRANITAQVKGYYHYTFIVLDDQSIQEETCLLVDVHDDSTIDALRTDFYVPVGHAIAMEMGSEWVEDGLLGSFMRSGVVMTKDNYELASHSGLYIEGGSQAGSILEGFQQLVNCAVT